MLALVFSALFTIYLLIPEGIFRLIFGLFIPPRSFVLTRVEKAYRAVLITVLPFLLAWALTWYMPGPRTWPFPVTQNTSQQRRADYKLVSAAFYSEKAFDVAEASVWHAVTRCSRRQARLVFWYFLLIALEAWLAGALGSNYPRLRRKYLKWLSDKLLSAYISQWHPLLQTDGKEVQADILCVNDMLYQGTVSQYFLKDGELSGIILQNPRRFDRESYVKAKGSDKQPVPKDYWKPIPSKNLYFFSDKIVNINLTYLTSLGHPADPDAMKQFLENEIRPSGDTKLKIEIRKAPAIF